MPVVPEPTPNPNAIKFTVGTPVGGPTTFVAGREVDDPMAAALLQIAGVTSVFMTADFVTISKRPEALWEDIVDEATGIISERFD